MITDLLFILIMNQQRDVEDAITLVLLFPSPAVNQT